MRYHTPARRRYARRTIDELVHRTADAEQSLRARQAFLNLVRVVRSNSLLLAPQNRCRHSCETHTNRVLRGLSNLARHDKVWIKSCDGWQPHGATSRSVFSSLVHDLIDVRQVPEFMVTCWLGEPEPEIRQWQKWYIHMARSGTILGTSTPYAFDREQAQCFATAPDHFTVTEALQWGLTRRRRTVDSHQKRDVYGISRRRRKSEIASRQQWSRGDWKPLGISSFHTDDVLLSRNGFRSWTIREILTRDELIREGKELNHCVGSYASLCRRGLSSIWSLKLHGRKTTRRMTTIEVAPRENLIVTALGYRNTQPSEDARCILEAWARVNGLQIASRV